MKKWLTSLLTLTTVLVTNAQDFDSVLQELSGHINTVQSGKKEYQQSIESETPGVVKLHIDEVDTKGKTKSNLYEFNLADIDKNTVRATAKGDVFTVTLSTKKKQKLIKKTVNDNKLSYTYNLIIYANDPENGRNLAEIIKKAIPIAGKILEKRLAVNGYSDRMNWIKEHVGNVELPKKQITQEFSENRDYPGSVTFHKNIVSGKQGKDITFTFNLAFLNPKQIDFYINGELFGLKIATKHSKKLIKVVENGEQKAYTNNFKIATNNVEEARDLQKVLTDIIPLAKQKLEAALPDISGLQDGFSILNDLTGNVQVNDKEYSQNWSGDCVIKLEQNINDGKKSYNDLYEFNLADLNKNQIKPQTKGKVIIVELKTKSGLKYIKYSRNDEVKGYKSTIYIYTPGPEQSITVQKVLQKMTGICQQKYDPKKQKPLNFNQAAQLLQENVNNFTNGDTGYEQSIELTNDNKSLKYQNVITTKSSSKELIYEVDLSDLNPKSIKIKVSGKKINVEIATKHLEKLIQYYKDGKIQAYQNKFNIPAPDIETARKIKRALHDLTKK